MIDPRELRLGNWFSRYGQPMQLTKDMWRDIVVHDDNENWESIPITPEVLQKCGHEMAAGTSDEIRFGRLVLQFSLYQQGYKVQVFIGGEYLGYKEYLHQLQNLYYALTNEELEINL